jgi:hypothetical protein
VHLNTQKQPQYTREEENHPTTSDLKKVNINNNDVP